MPSDCFGRLFDIRWYPGSFNSKPIDTDGRDDEAVISIHLWNQEVSSPVWAPGRLKYAQPDSFLWDLFFHGFNWAWYVEYTIVKHIMTRH